MRIKSFGHDWLQGHLLKGSEINKRFGHSRTHISSPTTHAVSRLWLFTFLAPAVTVGETKGAMDSTSVFFLPLLLPITL